MHIRPPTRQTLMDTISGMLGIGSFDAGAGSSVYSPFIDSVAVAIGLDPDAYPNKYRRVQAILETLSQQYNPTTDSSEHRGHQGGGTITNPALVKMIAGLQDTARLRYFIAPQGNQAWSGTPVLAFADGTPGLMPLIRADGSAQVLVASENVVRRGEWLVQASGSVEAIDSPRAGVTRLTLAGFTAFLSPVATSEELVPAWDGHSIIELPAASYGRMLNLGDVQAAPLLPPGGVWPSVDPFSPVPLDRPIHGRLEATPAEGDPRQEDDSRPTLGFPETLPPEVTYGRRRQGRLDRWAELRAVHICVSYMSAAGWKLARDRQLDRAGYDLEFVRGAEALMVEVKGIQSDRLAFNMTGREWATARASGNYVVFAVTDVLSPTSFTVHALGQDRLLVLRRRVSQYRLEDDGPA